MDQSGGLAEKKSESGGESGWRNFIVKARPTASSSHFPNDDDAVGYLWRCQQ